MLAIVVSLKLWGKNFKGKRIKLFCNNQSVCEVVTSGRANSGMLQRGLTAFLAATMEFEIKMVHLQSHENRISDHLSRFHLNSLHITKFFELTEEYELREFAVHKELFKFTNDW